MDNKIVSLSLKDIIKKTIQPAYENTAGTEIRVRCPHCGDSKKNLNSAHLYISLEPPFKFYCQKCHYSGIVTQSFLEQLHIYNYELTENIKQINKTIKNKNVNTSTTKRISYSYTEQKSDQAIESLNYFNNRFGVNESFDTISKFKIILDPLQFFKYLLDSHHIEVRLNPLFDYKHSIGFLSSDNKYLICRDTSGQQHIRYSNTLLLNQDSSKIYNIKTNINLLQDEITLVITEGIFDAIGIYYKEYKDQDNVIIAAACGKSFLQVIKHFLKKSFLNLNIKIYSDQDVDVSFYKNMKKDNKNFFLKNKKIEVYYNTKEKDCGTKAENIVLEKKII